MLFQIEVLTVTRSQQTGKTGKPYFMVEVAYKRDGKVEGKKLLEFNAKEVCKALENASTGDKYDIVAEKEGDFWQWKSATPSNNSQSYVSSSASSGSASSSTSATKSPVKSEWETREERQLRQVYIIKQSSLGHAIETLKTDKNQPDPKAVLSLAQEYTNWVMAKDVPQSVERAGVAEIEDDLPWEKQ